MERMARSDRYKKWFGNDNFDELLNLEVDGEWRNGVISRFLSWKVFLGVDVNYEDIGCRRMNDLEGKAYKFTSGQVNLRFLSDN